MATAIAVVSLLLPREGGSPEEVGLVLENACEPDKGTRLRKEGGAEGGEAPRAQGRWFVAFFEEERQAPSAFKKRESERGGASARFPRSQFLRA